MTGDTQQPHPDRPTISPAGLSSGLKPRVFRFISMASGPRLAIGSVVLLSLFMVASWMGGEAIRAQGGVKPTIFGLGLMICGALAGLIALLMAFLGVVATRADLKNFQSSPLIAGIVVTMKPNIVLGLVEMGRSIPGVSYALCQKTIRIIGLPDPAPGTRIPCFARPVEQIEADTLHIPDFELITWGTADPSDLRRCFDFLGEEPFRRLEMCVRRGPVPSSDSEKILLDEELEFVGKFGRPGEQAGDGPSS